MTDMYNVNDLFQMNDFKCRKIYFEFQSFHSRRCIWKFHLKIYDVVFVLMMDDLKVSCVPFSM